MYIELSDADRNLEGMQFPVGIPFQDHDQSSDEELVALFVEDKDESAFNEIVNRYGEKIHRLALRITHNTRYADEVLQEVFLTLVKKLYSFRKEAKFSTWLYRVATNTSLMYLRDQKKYDTHLSLEDYQPYDENGNLIGVAIKDWSSIPDYNLIGKEGMEKIEMAIGELPEKYKIVFLLRDVEGLSNEEVGNILELSIPAVKSRIHRARLYLRDKLSDYFFEWRKRT